MSHPFADDPRAPRPHSTGDLELATSIASRCNSALIASIASLFLAFCCMPAGVVFGYIMYQRASGLIEEIAMTNLGTESLGTAKAARILSAIGFVLSICFFLGGIARAYFSFGRQ